MLFILCARLFNLGGVDGGAERGLLLVRRQLGVECGARTSDACKHRYVAYISQFRRRRRCRLRCGRL